MVELTTLLPDAVSPVVAPFLIFASFFTSGLTATFGIGGGLAMLALMGLFLPVAVLIPIHGVVQLGSNTGRAWQMRSHIAWRALWPFFIGGALGAALAGLVVVELPDSLLKIILGVFVIGITWAEIRALAAESPAVMGMGGFVTTALSLFLGATGPLVMALFGKRFGERLTLVATTAAAMTYQHLVKVLVFGLVGFAFAQWLPLVAAMIASGYLGTMTGIGLLRIIPEERFRFMFKLTLTVLGAHMIWRGVAALI